MATISISITVNDADTGSAISGAEVEIVGIAAQSTVGGVARFTVEEGVGYDLKVRSVQLRPTYKDSGEFWLTEYVEQKVDASARGRYRQLAGQDLVWGVTFSASSEDLKSYDVQMKRQLRRAGTVSATPGGKVVFDKPALEDVIVVGTNVHDNSYGNKTMFLAQAVRAIRSRYSGDAFVSLLVFPDGYTAGEIDEARTAATGFNGNLVFQKLSSKDELVKYINTRTTDGSRDYRRDDRILVRELRVFSHGKPSVLTFDLDGPKSAALAFGISDVASLDAAAFAAGAVFSSYACRTGNSSGDESFGSDWRDVAKPETSLAQALADRLGIKVRGYVTRSNYGPTYNDHDGKDDAAYHAKFVDLDDPGTGYSVFHPSQSNLAIWNRNGAFNDPVSGKTPSGLHDNGGGGVFVFRRGMTPSNE